MSQNDSTQQISGVPAGLVAEPVVSKQQSISGVPAGLVSEPIGGKAQQPASAQMQHAADAPKHLVAEPVQQQPKPHELRAWNPSLYDKSRLWFLGTDTGRTLANSFDEIHRMASTAWEKFNTPFGGTQEDWKDLQKKQNEFIDRHIPKSLGGSEKLGGVARGASKGALEFGESMSSPTQIALMVGTFGENALAQVAAKTGMPKLVTAARTVGKLIQAQFISQMGEGAYTDLRDSVKSFSQGDWEAGTQAAVGGLTSLWMAREGVNHAEATERVQTDLNKTAKATHGTNFDSLTPEQQGLVIDETVNNSPEYKALVSNVDAANEKERQKILKSRNIKAARYADAAYGQAWNPDASKRAVHLLGEQKAESARVEQVQKVADTLKSHVDRRAAEIKASEEEAQRIVEEGKQEGRDARAGRRSGAAQSRADIQQSAEDTAKARQQTFDGRQSAGELPTEEETARQVEAQADENGHVSYPAQFWGETNTFGVGTDGERHSIYRQTPRGVEWMDANGNFTETPEDLYSNPDPEMTDTVARLSSLKQAADGIAAQPEATPEEIADAEKLGGIQRQLVNGEIDTRTAQKQAGIAEKASLPDVHVAAREGRLNGPFHEKSSVDYSREFEDGLREAGFTDEQIQASLESLPEMARMQVESNLHHVYQPGDYIVSKRDVKWTLDSNGLLHPSDGSAAMPLMKRGVYSPQALQLASSGRVGYGQMTRQERRAAFSRERDVKNQIRARQAEFDREMRIAQQNSGLETIPYEADVAYEPDREERRKQFIGRPPVPEEIRKERLERRAAYKVSNDPENIINQLAKQYGITPDEVMRIGMSERTPNIEAKAASLEVGDQVSDSFRPDRPWVVEKKGDKYYLRSGQANPIPFDRLNPSKRVLQILERGEITRDRDWSEGEKQKVAFDKAYLVHQRFLADEVKERKGKTVPEPTSERQLKAEVEAAERRTGATESLATKDVSEALNPVTTSEDIAVNNADKAADSIKLAEEAYAQQAEVQSQAVPKDAFPQRAPASIGYKGEGGTLVQNSREFPFHYELLPVGGLLTSHRWEGLRQVPNPEYPSELQPRTISEQEAQQNAFRAERGKYDFRQYADKTINGSMGPAIVDVGGQVVGGNTRTEIMKRHIQNIDALGDSEQRIAEHLGFKAAMRKLAEEVGISRYPDDGLDYAVVRMLDKPIETTREAAELGRLFNKSVGVQISRSAKGISYAKSFAEPQLEDIGRRVEANDGLISAMESDPDFFRSIVTDTFQVVPEEYADWFRTKENGDQVLSDQGRDQFIKSLLGRVIADTTVLNRIEGRPPYKALERAFGYVLKMKALPDRDISDKIDEAMKAAADTQGVDTAKHSSRDAWKATYTPEQTEFVGMESEVPPEPDRMVETLWRATNAGPRVLNDRLKSFIGEETSKGGWIFGEHYETPVEAFNRAFSKELKEVAHSRGDKNQDLTQADYDAALQNRELSDIERADAVKQETKTEEKPAEQTPKFGPPPTTKKGIEPPPKATVSREVADLKIAQEKTEQGYVTPQQLRDFLSSHPATKEHASELMRTAQMMAEYVYDADPPVGVERKQALDWVLKERLARIESGDMKSKRGEYSDPALEKEFGSKILKLHKAADPTTFIHEFSHVIFPLLSDEDLKAIDSIGKRAWDGNATTLKGDVYAALSEKLAHGVEQFLRDENPTGFTSEVKSVLRKIKDIARKVYLAFKNDPLSEYQNSEESREVFARMFGITDFDVADVWRDEVKKARAEEKKIKKPADEPHPVVKLARELGGNGLRESIDGKIVDEVGDRVDPKKPTAVITFPSEEAAVASVTEIAGGKGKIAGAELIHGNDGTWGVKINAPAKVPRSVLYQDVPERHPGLQLEDLEKRLSTTPPFKTFERRLLQMQIDNLKNRIRSEAGIEDRNEKREPELPKQVLQEVKGAQEADRGRKPNDGVSGIPKPPRVGGIPEPPKLGVSGHAGPGRGGAKGSSSVGRAPVSLADVKPVILQPLTGVRGEPVGTTFGEKFDQKAWVEGLKRAGMPEGTPAPTWALDPKTAAQLIYPGQKQVVQTILSGLQEGDGVAVITPTGSGKDYTGAATVKEYLRDHPDAKILRITKNRTLLKKSKRISANTFGFDVELDAPEGQPGVYGASYTGIMNNGIYKNLDWDLVVADESGEARRWYDEDTKQGQTLRDVVAQSKKAVYMSATPFHSPMEYGYLDKLNLWPKGQFDKWIQENFAHEKVGDKIVARLDPGKQAKLRQQLIERGQFISQAISYDGYNAHFGVVPVTDGMKRGLDRIREGFSRARDQFVRMNKPGLAKKVSAFEAVYTKNFLERERLPQAIELAKKARDQGWRVLFFSEHTADDLFRRERIEGEDPSTYQQLDDAMGGQLSRIIPPYGSIYNQLHAHFGEQVGDYSGAGNTDAAREKARTDFLRGEAPMLYASYAGGGIGVDMHDADFPELGIKGGDKPIVAIYLGPPYSGVLLEQAMGRPWRFGVKSDVHAVFLATDSEPDIRLMQTKVGPRMKALRAAVLGEKDSLANVMSTYTDEEKVRERQDQLAYAEGNEMKLDATKFQVRSKTRNVGIQDWSAINFPSANEAKNKGMKYGEAVTGGDWSTLYQSKFDLRPPDSPEDAAGKTAIDKVGNAVSSGRAVPPQLEDVDPAERKDVVGLASATATEEVDLPLDRDKRNTAVQSMTAQMQKPFPYYGLVLSQELGMENIARRAGKPEVGKNLKLMNRHYRADYDVMRGNYWNLLQDTFDRNKVKTDDKKAMWTITRVLEGKESTTNEAYNRIAADLSDMMRIAHQDLSKEGVTVKGKNGNVVATYGKDFGEDPHYYPHRIDWDARVVDPVTGEMHTLGETMKPKFDAAIRKRIIENIPELKPYSYQQVLDYMRRNDPKAPVLSNIRRAREVNFPYVKRDYDTLVGYFDQVAQQTSQARHFGPENERLNSEIKKVDDINGISTVQSMFRTTLEPQNWNDWSAKIYNAAIAYETTSKMMFSAAKVPYHLGLVPLGMEGRVKPIMKAVARLATHPREVMENAGYVGVLTRQLNAADIMYGERQSNIVRQILKKELFEASYKIVRAISGESARVYLDQYAIKYLRKGGSTAEHTRRLLRDTFLIGDGAIDEALSVGRFSHEDIGRAQTAFANLTTFSDDPLQMPQLARAEIAKGEGLPMIGLKRAVRLTYALQSFSLKATSLLREKLFDEVVIHKNYRPLGYAIVASPIIGQLLAATGAGAKHVVHRGLEGLTGHKHQQDSWDRYLQNLEKTFGDPSAVGLLKFIVDGYTLGYGWDAVRTVADPLLDLAKGDTKKSGQEFKYLRDDLVEHLVGPFFSDVLKTADEAGRIGQIEAGKRNPGQKPQKVKRSIGKYLEEQVPALREVPPFEDVMGIKPPPK
jgi:hypothetical protein